MEKNGRYLLIAGILLTLFSVLLTKDYFPDEKWVYLLSDITLIFAAVMVVWGFVLVLIAKIRKAKR